MLMRRFSSLLKSSQYEYGGIMRIYFKLCRRQAIDFLYHVMAPFALVGLFLMVNNDELLNQFYIVCIMYVPIMAWHLNISVAL